MLSHSHHFVLKEWRPQAGSSGLTKLNPITSKEDLHSVDNQRRVPDALDVEVDTEHGRKPLGQTSREIVNEKFHLVSHCEVFLRRMLHLITGKYSTLEL